MAQCPTLMFFVVVAINLTPGLGLCNDGFKFHNATSTCIKLIMDRKKYLEAREFCNTFKSGHLVKVLENSTNNFLKDLLKEMPSKIPAWIGLDKLRDKKHYYWNNETLLGNFTNWSETQRNPNANGSLGVEIGEDGWNHLDVTGRYLRSFFCQTPPNTQQSVQSQGNGAKDQTTSQPGRSTSGTRETNNINLPSEDASDARQPDQSQGNGANQQTTSQGGQATSGTSETNNENIPSGKTADTRPTGQIQGNRADQQITSQQGQANSVTSGTNNENIPSDIPAAQEPKSVQVENNNDLIVIVVPASICVVLALVVTLVIVVLVLRRKTATRNIQDKGEPTYAVVQDVETKRDYIGTNIDETYAVVNKKQKENKKDVGPQDFNPLDETYAAVNKNKKTNRGDTVASTDPVSNPMAQPKGMHFNMAALREEADGSAVYKKVQKEHGDFSTEDKTQTNSTEGSGRYLNEDGLVYVTVELNPVAPKSTIKPATIVRDERYEPVEYSTIVPGQGAKKDETNNEA